MIVDILITGTGSLAEEVLLSLVKNSSKDITIHIFGRNIERLKWLQLISKTQSILMDKKIIIGFSLIRDWTQDNLVAALKQIDARLILHTASVQSAWMLKQQNQWNSLVKKFGYGLTTTLQCHLLLKISQALSLLRRDTPIINASYPDVTNFILHRLGFPVIAGVGNISIMDALLSSSEQIKDKQDLFFYAHHYHISKLIEGDVNNLPLIYYKGLKSNFFSFFQSNFKLPHDESLNSLTGFVTALQILAFLGIGEPYIGHMPGINGLLGGYPVHITESQIQVRQFDLEDIDVIQANFKNFSALEGVIIEQDSIGFCEELIDCLRELSIQLPNQINFSNIDKYSQSFLKIQEALSLKD